MALTLSLDQTQHAVTLLNNLKQMVDKRDHCDFIIQVGRNEYHVQRNVLAACSSYFKAMLRHDMKESRERRVEMKDVDSECMKCCIDFIYSGKLHMTVTREKIRHLFHITNLIQLENIAELAFKQLSPNQSNDVDESGCHRHAIALLENLYKMKESRDLCDVMIKFGNKEYHAHQNILAASSSYFKALLKGKSKRKLELTNVDSQCLLSCIDYIYTGKLNIPQGDFNQILHVANILKLNKVKVLVTKHLEKHLNARNYYPVKELAKAHGLKSLLTKCTTFRDCNFMEITTQIEFLCEEKSFLIEIFKSKTVKLTEEGKLIATLRWFRENPDENIVELIKRIKLNQVPIDYLRDLLETNPLFTSDFILYKMLNVPLLKNARKCIKTQQSGNKRLIIFDELTRLLHSYNPVTNNISEHSDEKFESLHQYTSVCVESYIYVLSRVGSVFRWSYKEKNSKWERMKDMIRSHGSSPPAVSHSGSIFVISGGDFAPLDSIEKYDPATNTWLELEPKPRAISSPTLVSLEGSIYCIGGYDGKNVLNILAKYTPSLQHWEDLSPMRKARFSCGAVAVDGKIYAIAGESHDGNKMECYDIRSDKWTRLSPMTGNHICCDAYHFNGWIIVTSCEGLVNKMEKYDIENNKWHSLEGRISACCIVQSSVWVSL